MGWFSFKLIGGERKLKTAIYYERLCMRFSSRMKETQKKIFSTTPLHEVERNSAYFTRSQTFHETRLGRTRTQEAQSVGAVFSGAHENYSTCARNRRNAQTKGGTRGFEERTGEFSCWEESNARHAHSRLATCQARSRSRYDE